MNVIAQKLYSNSGNEDVLALISAPGTVLDVGCGTGDNARLLSARGCTVTGITISEKELSLANPYVAASFLYNLENGLPPELRGTKFDYVLCSHVLEHICYPEKLLAGLHESLAENGKLIVALPNLFHYASRWRLLLGRFDYQDAGIWDNTHFKWYSFASGKSLLQKNRFHVIHSHVTGQVPGYSILSKLLPEFILKKLFAALSKSSPGLFGYQLIYVATR